MMAGRLKLEVFETGDTSAETVLMETSALEEARLASFESGYTAGWDDAVAAQKDDQLQIRADLARNLQALSFTYHEARAHILKSMGPLIGEMARKVLPAIAQDALPHILIEQIRPIAEKLADVPITILLNPATRPSVEAFLEQQTALPVTLIDEPTVGEGQAYLRFGEAEQRIDLQGVTAAIQSAVADFFSDQEEERRHG